MLLLERRGRGGAQLHTCACGQNIPNQAAGLTAAQYTAACNTIHTTHPSSSLTCACSLAIVSSPWRTCAGIERRQDAQNERMHIVLNRVVRACPAGGTHISVSVYVCIRCIHLCIHLCLRSCSQRGPCTSATRQVEARGPCQVSYIGAEPTRGAPWHLQVQGRPPP